MPEHSAKNALTILVVEDNRTQAEYLRYILVKGGYTTIMASNGYSALNQITALKPDIVLTDVQMPDMDGYELCRTIKDDDTMRTIPVILVTHLAEPSDVIKGLESGADNFIIKPYEPEYILEQIQSTHLGMTRPDPDGKVTPLEVVFSDVTHTLKTSRTQILNILLSTYETAIKNNVELHHAHDQLQYLHNQQKESVNLLEQTNEELYQENSERQHAEMALATANKKLQLMTSITRHDLLNQLHSLQGYLDLAQSDWVDDPDTARTFINKAVAITKQTINTATFTGEYQDIGIESPQWMNIRTLVNRSTTYTDLDLITLENLIPEQVEIFADPMIENVFSNLIGNAVRYGQKITTIRFSLSHQDKKTVIVCEDDGIGISQEEKEKIFNFKYGGNTGLGLFLAREILSITGISIHETGILHVGARFEITCPPDTIRDKR